MRLSPKIYDKDYFEADCGFETVLTLYYDRKMDKIVFKPCSSLIVDNFIEPIAWDPDFFIDNLEYCLDIFRNYNLDDLNVYYGGNCEYHSHLGYKKVCHGYNYNKNLKGLSLEITKFCNLNCKMCVFDHKYNKRESDLYIRLLDKLKKTNLSYLNMNASGETFLYKDQVFDFLENNNYDMVTTLTNASLLSKEDLDRLARYRNLQFVISIDACSENTYNNIRIGSNYKKVYENMIYARDIKLLDYVNYVIQEDNINELDIILDYFNKLNIQINILVNNNFSDYNITDDHPVIKKFKKDMGMGATLLKKDLYYGNKA